MIDAWEEGGKQYEEGLDIFLNYGPAQPNITRLLQSPRRTQRQRLRLDWELEKMKRLLGDVRPPDPQPVDVKKTTKTVSARRSGDEPVDPVRKIVEDTFSDVSIETADELAKRLKRLYLKRAKLSNALEMDNGDPRIIERNRERIERLAEIMTDMKEVEIKLKVANKERPKHVLEQKDPIVYAYEEQYTLSQLTKMSTIELKKLRSNAQKRFNKLEGRFKYIKKEKTKIAYQEEKEIRHREAQLITRLLHERKAL